jgi:hypothetical protein
MKPSSFKCPTCGCTEWGSFYNFDGPGDMPINPKATGLDSGGRSVEFKGTFTRMCHGYISLTSGYRACAYTWNSRDDLAHGILPPSSIPLVGWSPPR